jgi:hypothetical protein
MTRQPLLGDSGAGPVYCASEPAIERAAVAYRHRSGGFAHSGGLADALIAAHHPSLGLDRSVCLRDVVQALWARGCELGDLTWNPEEPAAFIEHVFGGAA